MDFIVVGNGPLSEIDRASINQSLGHVIRFNDMNNWRVGEPMTTLVVRVPSAKAPPKDIPITPVWFVSPYQMPPDESYAHAIEIIYIYEPKYEDRNVLSTSAQLFKNCTVHAPIWQNATYWGPSTGAAILDFLDAQAEVARIDVYGMNWNGNRNMHVDFKYPTAVSKCCNKCVIHPTPTKLYGDEINAPLLLFVLFVVVLGVFSLCFVSVKYCRFFVKKRPRVAMRFVALNK